MSGLEVQETAEYYKWSGMSRIGEGNIRHSE